MVEAGGVIIMWGSHYNHTELNMNLSYFIAGVITLAFWCLLKVIRCTFQYIKLLKPKSLLGFGPVPCQGLEEKVCKFYEEYLNKMRSTIHNAPFELILP